MTDFVVDLGGVGDGLGDFVAKQMTVALTKPVDETLHCSLWNSERLGQRRVRNIVAFRAETWTQGFKNAQLPLAFAFFTQASNRLFHDGSGPAQIKEPLGWPRFKRVRGDHELRRRLRHPVVPGNKLHVATAFSGAPFVEIVEEQILERF